MAPVEKVAITLDGETFGVCTREQFEQVWEPRGWKLDERAPRDSMGRPVSPALGNEPDEDPKPRRKKGD